MVRYMGVLNYYIDIVAESDTLYALQNEYAYNTKYQEAFTFGITMSDSQVKERGGISSFIDNFLPANNLIFELLSNFKTRIRIKTNGVEVPFNFNKKAEFICFMYSAWENEIDHAYKEYGTILLPPKKYYKVRNRLCKFFRKL